MTIDRCDSIDVRERLNRAWDEFVSDSANLKEFKLGFDAGFDVRELIPDQESGGTSYIKFIGFHRRDFHKWLDRTLLCPMCNQRTNYRHIDAPFYWRHREPSNNNHGRICFYSGHPVNKLIDDAELTASQVALMLGRSDSWVLSLIKYGILKAEVYGNMYVIRKKDIGNRDDMKKLLKLARKEKCPRVNYINCHVWRTHLPIELLAEYKDNNLVKEAILKLNQPGIDELSVARQKRRDEAVVRPIPFWGRRSYS